MSIPLILAAVGGVSSLLQSDAQNDANDALLEAQKESATFRRLSNTARSMQAAEEFKLQRANEIMDLKDEFVDVEGQVAIHRGEGITAGVSAGRELQTLAVKESKAIGDVAQKARAGMAQVLQAGVDANSEVNTQLALAQAQHDANVITPGQALLGALGGGLSLYGTAGGFN